MTASALFSGVRSTDGSGQSSHAYCAGPTADQLVANAIGGGTLFPSREYRAQALFYSGNGPDNARDLMSWKRGSDGKAIANPPEASPAAAFTTLFENVTPPASPDEAKKRDFLLRSRKSVLDLVAGDTQRLVPKLGREDQARINQHLQEIRDLEQRLQASAAVGGTCPVPGSSLADPPIDDGTNYSGEDDRAARFCDLIVLAFSCDLTRVATLMLTTFQSSLNMGPLIGTTAGLHDIGHKFDKATANKAIAWHMKHYARLVAKLRDTKTPTGTLLDDAAIVFLCEGGVGVDPSVGSEASVHSSENMACLIAGRAGGIAPGKHVVATGKAPANVLISAMQAVGVQGGLGEVSGSIPELVA
jgi:hypothetical protein